MQGTQTRYSPTPTGPTGPTGNIQNHDRHRCNLFKKPKTRTGAVTRSADDPHHLPTPRTRLEIRKNFFTVRIVEKWNALPIEIKSLGKIQHFKRALNDYLG